MVKKSGLITGLSHALGLPPNYLALVYRALSEEKLISFTGGRGVNGPDLTPLDCSRIVTAVLVTDRPALAAQAVRDFGSMPLSAKIIATAGQEDLVLSGEPDITFENFLADHFMGLARVSNDAAVKQSLLTHITVTPRRLQIEVTLFDPLGSSTQYFNEENAGSPAFWKKQRRYEQRIEVVRSLIGAPIAEIASIFGPEELS
jgi:hypothetical protein